jgi:hypothetical protein
VKAPGQDTTAGPAPNPRAGSRAVWLRRAFLGLLAVIVVIGALDLLGVKSRTVTATSADGSVTLSVHYPHIARAGLDVPFDITVERDGGFTGDVTITLSNDYLALFDRSGIDPEPTSSTATDKAVVWRIALFPGSTLRVSLDMQV